MRDYVAELMADVKAKNPAEPEFHQAVQEVLDSLTIVLEQHPEYRREKILERIIEPERVIMLRNSAAFSKSRFSACARICFSNSAIISRECPSRNSQA